MNDIDSIEEFKAVTIGLDGVGKTSLINCYSGQEFEDNIYSTVASSCYVKKIKFENLNYSIRIWDTPGREVFIRLLRIFLKNAHIIILVFDMTKKESFLYLDRLNGRLKKVMRKNLLIYYVPNFYYQVPKMNQSDFKNF